MRGAEVRHADTKRTDVLRGIAVKPHLVRHAPVLDDKHVGAVIFQLRQDVGGNDDGLALLAQVPHHPGKSDARVRVHARGRCVEDKQARVVDERKTDAEALAVTARQRARLFLQPVGDADFVRHIDNALADVERGNALAPRHIGQALAQRQRVVKPEVI